MFGSSGFSLVAMMAVLMDDILGVEGVVRGLIAAVVVADDDEAGAGDRVSGGEGLGRKRFGEEEVDGELQARDLE